MALKEIYAGSVGPLYYDDSKDYPDGDPFEGFRTPQIYIEDAPSEDYHAARKVDIPVPGGLDSYVQYNDGGTFGGDATFQWDKTTHRLYVSSLVGIGQGTPKAQLHIEGSSNPAICFTESGASAGNKNAKLLYGSDLGAFILQDWPDNWVAGSELTRWAIFKDGSIHMGSVARPSDPGTLQVSSGPIICSGNKITTDSYLESTVATGTAPIAVSSITVCSNLNADKCDGYHSSDLVTGWIPDINNTWVYVSSNSFKIVNKDVTAIFTPGTKLKWTQTSIKYAYVKSSTFSTDTTVTIQAGDDYSVANATITSPYYSYASNPLGFPHWFNFTETWTGFSVAPSGGPGYRFCVVGRMARMIMQRDAGTSNATGVTVTLPFPVAAGSIARSWGFTYDNTNWDPEPGQIVCVGGSDVATCYRKLIGGWTSSGSKVFFGELSWEI